MAQGRQVLYHWLSLDINSSQVPFIRGIVGDCTGVPETLIDGLRVEQGHVFSLTSLLSGFHQRDRAAGEQSLGSAQGRTCQESSEVAEAGRWHLMRFLHDACNVNADVAYDQDSYNRSLGHMEPKK